MRLIFIRHGKTTGNLEKRYVGRTDEPLCGEGITELKRGVYPGCGLVIASPMKRCTETAELLFPEREIIVCEALKECDFGDFEGKNYAELNGNPVYQQWIDSGGTLPFPNGEPPGAFRKRCAEAFGRLTQSGLLRDPTAFVVHGGTIMAILEKYAFPKKEYFDFLVPNGGGYVTEWDGERLSVLSVLPEKTRRTEDADSY